jgi:hypothetical protein
MLMLILMLMRRTPLRRTLYQTPLIMRKLGLAASLPAKGQPLEISTSNKSNDESDGEPRRSGRVRWVTRIAESQLSQIEKGLIPAPGARAKVRALNAKKKQNTKESQLDCDAHICHVT